MRLRNIPQAEEIISKSEYFVHNPRKYYGQWFRFLGNEYQIHIEIGSGKGQFLLEMAKENPDINYIGIEHYSSVLLRAIQKVEADPVPNLHYICVDASVLTEIFEQGEVDKIYLNFPDPWPKDRHEKRRLTSPIYLNRFGYLLAEDGDIEIKTDNKQLYEYTLDQIRNSKIWKIDKFTDNLHFDQSLNEDNVLTEYEERFSSKGNAIYKIIFSYEDFGWNHLSPLPDISHQPNLWEIDQYEESQEEDENVKEDQHIYDAKGCLKVTSWCEGKVQNDVYSFVIRIEHKGDHQSYGQILTLELSENVYIVEIPGDVYADSDGRYVHIHRHNQLTGDGLTEIWIRLAASSQPEVTHIYDISCR